MTDQVYAGLAVKDLRVVFDGFVASTSRPTRAGPRGRCCAADDVHAGYGRSIVLHGVSVAAPADGVAAVMGHSGAGVLTQLLPRRAGLLSGGRRQQLAIARALVTGPELVGFALRAAERS